MRNGSAFLLVLVATVVAPFVIATTWLTARVDDRQEYVDTVAPLADDPVVRQVLADATADGAVAALQKHVPVGLPSALSEWARLAAAEVIESPDFPAFWRKANEDVHRQAIPLLEDPDASTEGRLTIDAAPLLAQVLLLLEERGVPVGLLPEIPLDVPIVERSKIAEAGPPYRALHSTASWLPLVWAGLVALAILISTGWRGRVRTAGLALLGVALAGGVVLLAADPVADMVADRAQVTSQELVKILLDAMLGSLGPYARGFLLAAPVGLVLVIGSLWSRRERRDASYDHDDRHHEAWSPQG